MKSLSNSLLFFPGLFLLILVGIPISSTFVVVVFFFFGENMREIIVFLVYVFHIFTCGLEKKKKKNPYGFKYLFLIHTWSVARDNSLHLS